MTKLIFATVCNSRGTDILPMLRRSWAGSPCPAFFAAALCLATVTIAHAASTQTSQRITLKEAEGIALANHPQIKAAQEDALAAGAVVAEARSSYYPQVLGSMTGAGALDKSRIAAGGINNPIIFNRYADGIMAGQLITDFGRTSNLVASTKLHAQAKTEDVTTTRAQVLVQVDRAYFGLLRADSIRKVSEETVNARQLVVDQVSALAKSKLKSDLDLSFAKVNLAEAQLALVQAQNDLKAANASLSAAMGYADQHTFELYDEPLPSSTLPEIDQAVTQAMHDRPELASSRFQRDSAERFATAEKDLWHPSISVLAGAGYIPLHDSNLTDRWGAVGMNANFPIFNGGLFSARRAEATYTFHADQEKVRALEDEIALDVRTAWLNADTAFRRLSLTQQLLQQASLALDLAQARYNLGLGSIVELSQAQLNKTQAEIEQAGAKYEYQIQRKIFAYQVGALH